MGKSRLNIGFLVDDLDTGFTSAIIKGAMQGAEELDANLFLFPGKYLKPDYHDNKMTMFNYQYNTIFSYAADSKLDVICVLLGVIASTRTEEEQRVFLQSLGDVPTIVLCSKVDGYPSICFDNKKAFYREIEHLITEHGATKIGFVSGPKTNEDAEERKAIFYSVMEKYQLEVPEQRVVYGDFSCYCKVATEQMLEQNPDLDAIVYANDSMALAGYPILKEKGLEIGRDIYVVGFDDETFALSMEPPLTTVKANGVDLGYKAVMQGARYISTGKLADTEINSYMIIRKSCGCLEPSGEKISKRLQLLDEIECTEKDMQNAEYLKTQAVHYLFDGGVTSSVENNIVELFSEMVESILQLRSIKEDEVRLLQQRIYRQFADLFVEGILSYTTTDRVFDVLRFLHYVLELQQQLVLDKVQISDLFYRLYRVMSEKIIALEVKNKEEINRMNHRVNSFTRDMITFGESVDASYVTALEMLKTVNMKSSFLYMFEEPKEHLEAETWKIPETVLLKAFHVKTEMGEVPEEKQKLPVSDILENDFTQSEERVTRILVPLFSGEKQYGLLLCELEPQYHSFVLPSVSKLSSVIRTIYMLDEQKKAKQTLEGHLQKAIEDNEYLENISKVDELSKIYNRRGFYGHAKNILEKPKLRGQKAVLAFGDLDGLKKINDQFGHECGDIAIRTIASILTDAFSSAGIVGRFGGDEFLALLMVSAEEFERVFLASFTQIKKVTNEHLQLPFEIDMSLGYIEFVIDKDISFNKLVESADENLYKQKKQKKNPTKEREGN